MSSGEEGGQQPVVVFKKAKGSRRSRKRAAAGSDEEGADQSGPTAVVQNTSRGRRGLESTRVRDTGAGTAVPANLVSGSVAEQDTNVPADGEGDDAGSLGSLQQVVDGDKIYTGEKAYASFFKTGENKPKGGGLRAGPVKAKTSFMRSQVTIDYNPSVCKDYKQTGYCGYGANCKYVHDRGDYKSGWEIDKEWNAQQKRGGEEENYEIDSSDDDDNGDLPFACFICKEPFTNPVVTKCGHYFCEDCALRQEKKTRRCFVCNDPTGGIFNPPRVLLEKLKKRRRGNEDEEDGGGGGGDGDDNE